MTRAIVPKRKRDQVTMLIEDIQGPYCFGGFKFIGIAFTYVLRQILNANGFGGGGY